MSSKHRLKPTSENGSLGRVREKPDGASAAPSAKRVSRLRRRFWVEAFLASAASIALLLTLALPEWIEEVFGADPDGGNGSAERLITITLALATVVVVALGASEWRRTRTATA